MATINNCLQTLTRLRTLTKVDPVANIKLSVKLTPWLDLPNNLQRDVPIVSVLHHQHGHSLIRVSSSRFPKIGYG